MIASPDVTSTTAAAGSHVDPATVDELELQSAVMMRNFELLRRRTETFGEITRAEYLLLRTLDSNGPTDIGGLAKAVGLDPSTVGRQVGAMQTSGLVARAPAPTDRRRSIIAPTQKGRRLMRVVREGRRKATEELLGGWTADDIRTLADMFRRWNETVAHSYLT